MKKLLLFSLLSFFFFGCSNTTTFTLDATTDHENDLKVFLIKIGDDNSPMAIDSTNVVEGKFSFSDSIAIPEMHYIVFDKQRENLPVILEPGKITVKIHKDSVRTSKISGTKSNLDFAKYMNETTDLYTELSKIQFEIRSANVEMDSMVVDDLNDQFESMKTKLTDYDLNFIKVNNDSYLSTLILQRMVMQQEIKIEDAEELYNSFTEIIKKTKSSIETKKNIELIKESFKESPTIGSLAPKFSGPGLDGNIIALDDIKSKVIMIDFWASWCAPCRVENPFLVYLNTKYNTDQFQVVGISLDREDEKWNSAIESDNLDDWIHISNLKFWGEPIAKLYNVRQMPTTFILDEKKRVIGMNIKGDELDNLILKQLSL
jgi:thiol-disulfide isomerase/thioredoxin